MFGSTFSLTCQAVSYFLYFLNCELSEMILHFQVKRLLFLHLIQRNQNISKNFSDNPKYKVS
jgi:hypothetical protein